MATRRRMAGAVGAAALALGLVAGPALPAAAGDSHCAHQATLQVPGADAADGGLQKVACLAALTTMDPQGLVATGHTDESDWAGLNAAQTRNPVGVPGIQVDGYFSDDDTRQQSNENGWNHDAQFVMRFPDHWNGGLVITGAPGIRKQYSLDVLISDYVLSEGFAYAAIDKGNSGNMFFQDSTTPGKSPGDSIAEWNARVTQLAVAAKATVAQVYDQAPAHTYVTGISNGGYLTRWQLENHPELYDGGVDWEGTLFRSDGPNLFTYLPVALRSYPTYQATGDQAAHDAMIAAGFAAGSEFLWPDHYAEYWDLTQRTYREELDPSYDGSTQAGTPFCQTGTAAGTATACDAQYDYASRPVAVKAAMAKVQLTGAIGKPMITLHGDLDTLLPIRTDSDVYNQLVNANGKAEHPYYVIQGGNHVDGRFDVFRTQLRPILPCQRAAFDAMVAHVEHGAPLPPSGTVPKPDTSTVQAQDDAANTCLLPAAAGGPVGGEPVVPEVPLAALLPLAALAVVGVSWAARRRWLSPRAGPSLPNCTP